MGSRNATALARSAMAGTGIEEVASCDASLYDARAPRGFRSQELLPGSRGLVVVGSAGPTLWRRFRSRMNAHPELWEAPHPYDSFVAELLGRADAAFAGAGVRFSRLEAAFHARPRVDFVALAQLVGFGTPGPFSLVIHPVHGPWWALRGAWLVDAVTEPPLATTPPCAGCPAPCVGGWQNAGALARATPQVRARCVVGQGARYDEDQIAYHYDRAATVARLRG
jgi:epoxyqueuosine reductase QueG